MEQRAKPMTVPPWNAARKPSSEERTRQTQTRTFACSGANIALLQRRHYALRRRAAGAAALPWEVDIIRIPCSLSVFFSTEMKPPFCDELNLST
jgi:hypothetical protein